MAFLTFACLPELEMWPEPLLPAPWHLSPVAWSGLLTAAALCLPLIQAFIVARRVASALGHNPRSRDDILNRYDRARFVHQLLLFGCFTLALAVGGWGWSVNQVWRAEGFGVLPVAELVVLAPFLVAMGLSWAIFYDAENALDHAASLLSEGSDLEAVFADPYDFTRRQQERARFAPRA